MICATLGQMEEEQVEKVQVKKVNEMVIKVMMKGMVYWLEAARHKRVLGMSVALVVLAGWEAVCLTGRWRTRN